MHQQNSTTLNISTITSPVIDFSLHSEPETPGINTVDLDFPKNKKTVLIIDDEALIVEEICEKLTFHGFHCYGTGSAEAGLALIISNPDISIVLTDIRMPGMNGLEFCRAVKLVIPDERDLVLLVMTGHAGISEALETFKVGALDFLTKPIIPAHLVHVLERAAYQVESRALDREFKERLQAEVALNTIELTNNAIELETTNAKLVVANQVKDEFLSMISHELRTPLNTIVGLSKILEPLLIDSKQRDYVKEINHAGEILTEIVNSMIDMVEVETGTLKLSLSEVSIADLIEKTIALYRGKLDKAGITIDANGVIEIMAKVDPLRISQVVGRLINNAIQFSPVGGIIQVSSRLRGNTLTISVRDDGPGMSEQEQKRALEPLRQVDGSTTRNHEGIGIGLTLVKMFSELHGGFLTIDSASGRGTLATITIPIR